MDANQSTEFQRRLVGLAELFDVKLSPQRIALYFEALRDLSLDQVIYALNQSVKSSKFFPRPVELRAIVLGDSEDRIERAWMAFKRAMASAGSYASLLVEDAALGEAILSMFGSWPQACAQELTPEMWASKRKEFSRVYRVLLDRHLDGARFLAGICERENNTRGLSMKYVPVHQIMSDGTVTAQLPPAASDQARMLAAVKAHGFTRLMDIAETGLRVVPRPMDETA